MSSNSSVIASGDLQKSITFHDFYELTQRQLADFSFSKSRQREGFTFPWQNRLRSREPNTQEVKRSCITRRKSSISISEKVCSFSELSSDNNHRNCLSSEVMESTIQEEEDNTNKFTNQPYKRPLNSTFSSWLQLFLAKRRKNRYTSSANYHIMHSSFSEPSCGPLRSSVSLCMFYFIVV